MRVNEIRNSQLGAAHGHFLKMDLVYLCRVLLLVSIYLRLSIYLHPGISAFEFSPTLRYPCPSKASHLSGNWLFGIPVLRPQGSMDLNSEARRIVDTFSIVSSDHALLSCSAPPRPPPTTLGRDVHAMQSLLIHTIKTMHRMQHFKLGTSMPPSCRNRDRPPHYAQVRT